MSRKSYNLLWEEKPEKNKTVYCFEGHLEDTEVVDAIGHITGDDQWALDAFMACKIQVKWMYEQDEFMDFEHEITLVTVPKEVKAC